MDTVKQLRYDILELLFKVDDLKTLKVMRSELNLIYQNEVNFHEKKTITNEAEPVFMKSVRDIRKNVTLETLMLEQNYKSITYQIFRASADKIEWGESLDELLAALSN